MRRRRLEVVSVILIFLCGAGRTASAEKRLPTPASQKAAMQKNTSTHLQWRTVTDESGRKVKVPVSVQRIVTLAPNLAEIVCALGLKNRLVAVSDFSNHPADARRKPRIGMPVDPSLEAIAGARPDVVLATSVNTWETVHSLTRLNIPVYTTDPHTVEGMLHSISDIGDAIGADAQARALVRELQSRLDSLEKNLSTVPPVTALFVVWDHPLISIGENTFIADALHLAGAQSVIRTAEDWPQISMEEVVRASPEYIVFAQDNQEGEYISDWAKLPDPNAAIARRLDRLRSDKNWRDIPAVRKGHIAVVSDEIDIPAPGLIEVIEQLAHELHPAIFQKKKQSASTRHLPTHEQTIPNRQAPASTFAEAMPCAR